MALARRPLAGECTPSSVTLVRHIRSMNRRLGVNTTRSTPSPPHTALQYASVYPARKPLAAATARQRSPCSSSRSFSV